MNCSSCGQASPEDARFCMHCAVPFPASCSSCGAAVPDGARFCPQCARPVAAAADAPSTPREGAPPAREPAAYTPKHLADKILTSRSALEGERKQVTVLFADVKGSMELAEQIDVEAWREILEGFFEILSEGVHRFEGTVNQYTGDGIMALFGAPIAHEDHAQRACYAALHLRGALRRYAQELRRNRGLNFSVRMGINSGEVVVGKIGADLRMDYTAQGHSVGLAQRMETIAEPGCAYVTEATQHLVEGFFSFTDLGPFDLKGVAEPVRVFELEDVGRLRTRLDVARARGLTRFVGRGNEMATLDAALTRAREGHGQAVGVLGEAGVGKSRLCLEFVERCRAQGIAVYEAHCPAHGKNVPFLPILELFRNYFGIADDDTSARARQKVAGALVLLDPALQETLPVLLEFLGVGDPSHPTPPLEAETRQRQLFAILHRLVHAQSERGVVMVTLIDDLHWVDSGSDAFVAQLVEAAEASRMLVLLNFRPEYKAAWSHRSHYHQLPLVPLGSAAVRELVESLLGVDPSVAGLAERIERWTAGNPFFTEEVIQTLIEGGQLEGRSGSYRLATDLDRLEVPSSVQAVLAARIDRLPEMAKHVLQTASVIGKEFSGPVLAAVAELPDPDLNQGLERLKTGDFIYERALYPAVEYAFKHPLSHEVAYESQLRDRKAEMHGRVARALEGGDPERLDERAALIAHHWEHANDPGRAMFWHQRAAEWTLSSDAPASLRHWQRVRELTSALPPERETLSRGAAACGQILTLRFRLGGSESEIERTFEEGKTLAERAGAISLLAQIHGGYAAARGIAFGDAGVYAKHAFEAVQLADRTDDRELQFAMRTWLTWGYLWSGRFAETHATAEDALARIPDDPLYGAGTVGLGPRPTLMMAKGASLYAAGDLSSGKKFMQDAQRDGARIQSPEIVSILNGVLCVLVSVLEGASPFVVEATQMAPDGSEGDEANYSVVVETIGRGVTELAAGHFESAVETLEQGLRLIEGQCSGGTYKGTVLGGCAQALLALGRIDEATTRAQEAVDFARSHGLGWDSSPWLTWIRTRLAIGDESGARHALEETQERIRETGAVIHQPHWHECNAALAGLVGDEAQRKEELERAHTLFVEFGAEGHAERVKNELATLT